MSVVNRHRVFALHPVSIAIRLKKLYKGFHGYFNHVFTTSTLEEKQRRKCCLTCVAALCSLLLYSKFSSHLFSNMNAAQLKEDGSRVYLCSHFAIVYPAHSGKICGFGTVETMIETCMVTIRKGDHELSRFLSNLGMEREQSN